MKDVHDDVITSVSYTSDGSQIVTNSMDNIVKVIDVRMFSVVQTLEDDNYYCGSETNVLGVSPGGRYAAVGSKNGKLVIFDLTKGEVEEVYSNEHTTSIVGCAW